jgi:hypothetical protein
MIKREIKRWKLRAERVLEPVAIVVLLGLFLLPTLTILNLTPRQNPLKPNVLGAEDRSGVGLALVGGIHPVVDNEYLSFVDDSEAKYEAKLRKREAGTYSKPVLEVTNFSSEEVSIDLEVYMSVNSGSELSAIFNNREYPLMNIYGSTFSQKIPLRGGEKGTLYLKAVNTQDLLFHEELEVRVGW